MASYQWIKLYDEILDDPKMGRLSDGAYRFCVNLFLLASRHPARDGSLPDIWDIAWTLRLSEESATSHLDELTRAGIVTTDNGSLFVSKFATRQSAVDVTERMKQYRDRKRKTVTEEVTQENGASYEDVTKSNTDIDIDIDKKKREKRKDKYIHTEIVPDPVNEMINAISKASGVTCAVGVNDSEFRESAYALIGNDIAPGDLPLFCDWWATNGHYKGKPAIKSILTKIRAAKDSDWQDLPTPAANGNGSHQPTERKLSNAEAGAVEYAAMRASLVRKP